MAIKHLKTKIKLAISAILAGLALYGVSVVKSIEDEEAYNRLPKNEKQVVDSLRRVGIEESEIKENIGLMSDALKTLQQIENRLIAKDISDLPRFI